MADARNSSEKKPRAGKSVAGLLAHPQDLLATLALGNTFANAAMLAVALRMAFNAQWTLALTMIRAAGVHAAGLRSVSQNPGGAAAGTLGVARRAGRCWFFKRSTEPLHRAAQWLNAAILKKTATQMAATPALTDAEYHELLEMAYQQGTLAESEKEIILQIISLDQRTARDVMRPRAGMAAISDDATVEEMIAAAKKFKHRRLPIYDETPDTIVGILNTRALLLDPKIDLSDAIEFPSFVPETMNLLQLFQSLQKRQRGLAIVLDEFGGTAGLVTMEDILGELIGNIRAGGAAGGFCHGKNFARPLARERDDAAGRFPPRISRAGDVPEVETMGGLLTHLLRRGAAGRRSSGDFRFETHGARRGRAARARIDGATGKMTGMRKHQHSTFNI